MRLIKLLFPLLLGPTIAVVLPGYNVKLKPSNILDSGLE